MRFTIAAIMIVMAAALVAQAEVPQIVNYQGTVKGADGMPLDEPHDLVFTIYDAETGGTVLWSETHTGVDFDNGIFSVLLGSLVSFPSTIYDPGAKWLGITVGDDTEMMPRLRLTSSLYAMRSAVADFALSGGSGGTLELPFSGSCSVDANYAMTIINDGIEGRGLQVHVTDDVSDNANYAGYFRSDSPIGHGVYAYTPGTNSRAIWGSAMGETAMGVVGYAHHDGPGVNYGGYFKAYGESGRAVYGRAENEAPGELNYGGYFRAEGGRGYGAAGVATGNLGRGVVGTATATGPDRTYGGYFVSEAGTGVGVRGIAHGDQGRGVWGYTDCTGSDYHHGGFFEAMGGTHGIGVYAEGSRYGLWATGSYQAGLFGGNVRIEGDAEVTGEMSVESQVSCAVLQITGGADLSESFDLSRSDDARPGMVVSIDAESPGRLKVSDREYDRCAAGVISGANGVNPGMIMGQDGSSADGDYPVALSGRVFCLADAGFGSIAPGDLLTTSPKRGHVMKVKDHARANGAIIGKAMTPLESGTGYVLVLVSLQ